MCQRKMQTAICLRRSVVYVSGSQRLASLLDDVHSPLIRVVDVKDRRCTSDLAHLKDVLEFVHQGYIGENIALPACLFSSVGFTSSRWRSVACWLSISRV